MKMFTAVLLAIAFAGLVMEWHIEHIALQYQSEAMSEELKYEAKLRAWTAKKIAERTAQDPRAMAGLATNQAN